jgi:MFS family permease
MTRRVALLCAAAFAGFASLAGLGFIVALRLEDAFGLSSTARGVVLACFGIAGMVSGRAAGAAVDRFGRIGVAVAGAIVSAGLVALIGFAGSPGLTAALWLAVGAASSLVWAGLNTLVIEAVPDNRAGATSVFGAFKFAGNAAAPLMFLPLYTADEHLAFVGAGVLAATVAAFSLALTRERRRGASTGARPSSTPPSRARGR